MVLALLAVATLPHTDNGRADMEVGEMGSRPGYITLASLQETEESPLKNHVP